MTKGTNMFASNSLRIFFALSALLFSVSLARAEDAAQSGEEIWKKTVAAYPALKSYSDTGTVTMEMPGLTEKHSFKSRFQGPRSYFFDFLKEGGVDRFVIWSDAQAFHTWWMTTQLEEEYPKGTGVNAFSQASYLTKGSAMVLSPLLFAGSGLQGTFSNYSDIQLDGTEKIGANECYRIVGIARDIYTATQREVNIRQVTVWVDVKTNMIRKVVEDSPKGTPPAMAGQWTTTFEPQVNPNLTASQFQFEPPSAN